MTDRVNPEIVAGLLDRHPRLPAPDDANHVVTEFDRIGLGHRHILPGRPHRQARSIGTNPWTNTDHLSKAAARRHPTSNQLDPEFTAGPEEPPA